MKEIIFAIFSMALGTFFYIASEAFSMKNDPWNLHANPAVYPRLLAIIIFALGAVHLINTLRKGGLEKLNINKEALKNVGKIVGLVLVYIIAVYYIGFIVATTLFMGVTIIVGGGSKRQAFIIPLPVTIGLFFMFQVLFAVPLPMGELLNFLR